MPTTDKNRPKIERRADPHGPRPVPMKEGQPSRPTPKPSIRPLPGQRRTPTTGA